MTSTMTPIRKLTLIQLYYLQYRSQSFQLYSYLFLVEIQSRIIHYMYLSCLFSFL